MRCVQKLPWFAWGGGGLDTKIKKNTVVEKLFLLEAFCTQKLMTCLRIRFNPTKVHNSVRKINVFFQYR